MCGPAPTALTPERPTWAPENTPQGGPYHQPFREAPHPGKILERVFGCDPCPEDPETPGWGQLPATLPDGGRGHAALDRDVDSRPRQASTVRAAPSPPPAAMVCTAPAPPRQARIPARRSLRGPGVHDAPKTTGSVCAVRDESKRLLPTAGAGAQISSCDSPSVHARTRGETKRGLPAP